MRWWVVAGVFALLLSAGAVRAEWATIVVDPASGRILQAENDRAPRYPASLAKMMTAYLVLEALREKRLTIERKLPIGAVARLSSPPRSTRPSFAPPTMPPSCWPTRWRGTKRVSPGG